MEKLNQTELLKAFVPAAEKPFGERSDSERATCNQWFAKASWFVALRRVGFVPRFEGESGADGGGASKKPRVS